MRLIDADIAYKVLTDYYRHRTDIQHKALKEAIERVPTVDAEPVKHGHWIVHTVKGASGEEQFGCAECSVCGDIYSEVACIGLKPVWDYCPNCGAKMDERREKCTK